MVTFALKDSENMNMGEDSAQNTLCLHLCGSLYTPIGSHPTPILSDDTLMPPILPAAISPCAAAGCVMCSSVNIYFQVTQENPIG